MVAIFATSHVGFAQQPTLHIPFPADSAVGVARSFTFKVIASAPIDTNSTWRKVDPAIHDSVESNWRPNVYLIDTAIHNNMARQNWSDYGYVPALVRYDTNSITLRTGYLREGKKYYLVVDSLRTTANIAHPNGQLVPSKIVGFTTESLVPTITSLNIQNRGIIDCNDTIRVSFSRSLKGLPVVVNELCTIRKFVETDSIQQVSHDTLTAQLWFNADSSQLFATPIHGYEPGGYYSVVLDWSNFSGDTQSDHITHAFNVRHMTSINTRVAYESGSNLIDTAVISGYIAYPDIGLSAKDVNDTTPVRISFPPVMGNLAFKKISSNIASLNNSTVREHSLYLNCLDESQITITAIYEVLEPVSVALAAAPGTELLFYRSDLDTTYRVVDSLTLPLVPHDSIRYHVNTKFLVDTMAAAGLLTSLPGIGATTNTFIRFRGRLLLPRPIVRHTIGVIQPVSNPGNNLYWITAVVEPSPNTPTMNSFYFVSGEGPTRAVPPLTVMTTERLTAVITTPCFRWRRGGEGEVSPDGLTITYVGPTVLNGRTIKFEYERVPVHIRFEQYTYTEQNTGGKGPEVGRSDVLFGGIERVSGENNREIRLSQTEYEDDNPTPPTRRRPFRVTGPCFCGEQIETTVRDRNLTITQPGDAFYQWTVPTGAARLYVLPTDVNSGRFTYRITEDDVNETTYRYTTAGDIRREIRTRVEFLDRLRLLLVGLDVKTAPAQFNREDMPLTVPNSVADYWKPINELQLQREHDRNSPPLFSEGRLLMISHLETENAVIRLAFNKTIDLQRTIAGGGGIFMHATGGIFFLPLPIDPPPQQGSIGTALGSTTGGTSVMPPLPASDDSDILNRNFFYEGFTSGRGHIYAFRAQGLVQVVRPNSATLVRNVRIGKWSDIALEFRGVIANDLSRLRTVPPTTIGYLESPQYELEIDNITHFSNFEIPGRGDGEFYAFHTGGASNANRVAEDLPAGRQVRFPTLDGQGQSPVYTDVKGNGDIQPLDRTLYSGSRLTKETTPFGWVGSWEQDCGRDNQCANRNIDSFLERVQGAVDAIGGALGAKKPVTDAIKAGIDVLRNAMTSLIGRVDEFAGEGTVRANRGNRLHLVNRNALRVDYNTRHGHTRFNFSARDARP